MRLLPLSLIMAAMLPVLAACVLTTPTPRQTPLPSPTPTQDLIGTPTTAPVSTPTPVLEQLGGRTFRQYPAAPLMIIDPSASYTATIRTSMGNIVLELFASEAPKTVNNFVFLAEDGFYNGVIFHRVIEDFMIQGGDPTATGTGGPGYNFEDEIVPSLVFDRPGLLAMANAGPGTNGSQFFITVVPTPWLNGGHTIFGQVVQGQGVVDAISMVPTGRADRPLEEVVIRSVDISGPSGS